jgi:transcriptional regulator with XRE-family HTH domain
MFHMRNIVGPRVRTARVAKKPKLTQAALAARVQLLGWDVSRGGVAKIEAGVRQVTDKELVLLAQALDVSVAWLFGEDPDAHC